MDKVKYKKAYTYLIYGILIVMMVFSLQLTNLLNGSDKTMIEVLLHMKPKNEIFKYLKQMQPLEDQFYKLVNKNMEFMNHPGGSDDTYLTFLNQNMEAIDDLFLAVVHGDGSKYMDQNKQLFFDEMKTMKDIMMEEKLYLENKDRKSLSRVKEYMEKYKVISGIRRNDLKKVFDKYDIIYIDLGDKIKYKIK